MEIKKGAYTYTVTERAGGREWGLTSALGPVSVTFQVSKDLCQTLEELRAYVAESDIFPGGDSLA